MIGFPDGFEIDIKCCGVQYDEYARYMMVSTLCMRTSPRLENSMAKSHIYSCIMAHGSSYGGNNSPFTYTSTHKAGSRGNIADAIKQFKRERGDLSWVEVDTDSIYKVA